jgi:uncharacterized protein with FMN-binding domain
MKNVFLWALFAALSTLTIVAIKMAADLPLPQHSTIPKDISLKDTLAGSNPPLSANPSAHALETPVATTTPSVSPMPLTQTYSPVATPSVSSAGSPTPSAAPSVAGTATPVPAGTASPATYKDGTFAGKSIYTPYGYVQVSPTISGGKITSVDFKSMPRGSSESVNSTASAQPKLLQETLQVQTASVDSISGATLTSKAYVQSLSSALVGATAN